MSVQTTEVLIIGSGAGAEVLDAVHYGASSVTAIEINPIIGDVIKHRFKDRWGGLFDQPEVRLVTAEGRSFVRRSHDTYDAIISMHTISNSAIASGALALLALLAIGNSVALHAKPAVIVLLTVMAAAQALAYGIVRAGWTATGILFCGACIYAEHIAVVAIDGNLATNTWGSPSTISGSDQYPGYFDFQMSSSGAASLPR